MATYDDGIPDQLTGKLVRYDTRCQWCAGRLVGIAFRHQVPKFCGHTHKKNYRAHQRPARTAQPKNILHTHVCRRCGHSFQTISILRSQICSVTCILKAASYDLWNKCWRKRAWLRKAAAIQAAWRLGQNTGDHGTAPYMCEYCQYWHIGHPKQGVKQMTDSEVDTTETTL